MNPRPPARILFVDHTSRLGGGEIALFNLVEALDRDRFTPLVLLFAAGPLCDRLRAAGVETHVLPLDESVAETRKDSIGGRSLLRLRTLATAAAFVWRVRRRVVELKPAVVHTNSLKSDILGGFAGRLAGKPVIWHVRDRIADDYLPRRVVGGFRWLAQRVPTMVIANSQSTLGTLSRQTRGVAIHSGIVDHCTWRVIHDGVATDAAKAGAKAANETLLVGMVGRLARWKGQHVFVEAARRLTCEFPNARFQIIGSALFGEDAYERELREAVARHGLNAVVEFTGFRKDVDAAIAGLDVLVHASITGEPFGQVIVEGMIAGKPVVATDGGGVPEIVVDGQTGLLVPMNDAAAMAAALRRLLSEPAVRIEMGLRGRERVLKEFTICRTAERVQAVYDQLLGRRAGEDQ